MNCRHDRRNPGLTTRRRLMRMQDFYQARYACQNGIRASYEIILLLAGRAGEIPPVSLPERKA